MRSTPTFLDSAILGLDQLLRTATGQPPRPSAAPPREAREIPGPPPAPLPTPARTRSIRLMRVNHAGEVAAQALYQGQAAVARDADTRQALLAAGDEERDHLEWCETRLKELGGTTSLLTPWWYAGSLAIGAAAGLAGDRWSLGFVAETERQVEEHLSEHLARLPGADERSRRILEQMQEDEIRHGREAMEAGGTALPAPVRGLMTAVAKVMTRTAYWL
jgi:ubiquinone biosynthesis monooxygenase Coq7